MLLHCSGQIPETAALYTYTPNTRRGEFTPREGEVKTERTLVELGLNVKTAADSAHLLSAT
jgi:hypothetical protein